MASIHIPFPEKDGPVAVALSGSRITIGRLPFNTVQIIDRTISGFHAELILENGHYRLHDRGSTNGTFVNGEMATDFHLREACKISFGGVECDFDPASEEAHAESVPTRSEMHAVRQENAELRGTLAAVREQVAALVAAKPAEEFTQMTAEREALKTAQLRQEQEVARLKGEVAVLRRDRENLQKAWDATKAELAKVQRRVEAVAVVDVAPASVVVAVPEPEAPAAAAAPEVPAPATAAPVSAPPPPVPLSRPAMPVAKPVVPLAPPTGQPFPAPKPGVPTVKLMPAPMPSAAGPQRPLNSSGVRPLPKAMPGAVKALVPANAVPKPVSGLHPRASVMAVHAPAVGPKGTQRIG